MPFYDLHIISRAAAPPNTGPKSIGPLGTLMKKTITKLINQNTIIRDIQYMGTRPLPYRMRLHMETVYEGSYWQVQVMAGTHMLDSIKQDLKYDPDIIRYTIIKRGTKLKEFLCENE